MEKLIPIISTDRLIFKSYVKFISLLTLAKIRPKAADVFAELLYLNYIKSDIVNKADRFKVIFDYDTKNEIKNTLGISDASLQNHLTYLRHKKLIEDNSISDYYLIYPNENMTIGMRFILNSDNRAVVKLTLSKEPISVYSSMIDAAKEINPKNMKNIIPNIENCCNKDSDIKSAYGDIWLYKDEFDKLTNIEDIDKASTVEN